MKRKTCPAPPAACRDEPRSAPAAGSELLWAALAIAGGMIVLTVASGSTFLVVRDFWLDEICTWLLTTDPSLTHALDALQHGADSNPPALYLLLRGLHALGMPLNETTFRLFAGGSAACGLLGCYALLRRVFDRVTSGAAIAALLAGDLLLKNMYEARFYDPWFGVCAWFCFALAVRRAKPELGKRKELAAGLAVAVLTPAMLLLHYFGLFTFLLAVPADFLADARPMGVRLKNRWPLLTCLPALGVVAYFYVHQRAAFTVHASWIDPPALANSLEFLSSTLFFWMLLALVGGLGAAWLFRKVLPLWRSGRMPDLRPLAGLLSLALLPLVVLLFSIVVQPANVERYTLPGIGGLAALAAIGLWRLRPAGALMLAGGWIVAGGLVLYRVSLDQERNADEQAFYRQVVEERPEELVLCELRHDCYPLALYAPGHTGRMYLLDFTDGEDADDLLKPTPAFCYVERDAGRAVERSYPRFGMTTRQALPRGTPFLLLAADVNGKRLERRFQFRALTHIGGRMFEMTLE